jgi:hypothetical protein
LPFDAIPDGKTAHTFPGIAFGRDQRSNKTMMVAVTAETMAVTTDIVQSDTGTESERGT